MDAALEKFRREELEAHRFAHELLMPEKYVREMYGLGMSVEQLADKFAVSPRIMRARLKLLGINEETSFPCLTTG